MSDSAASSAPATPRAGLSEASLGLLLVAAAALLWSTGGVIVRSLSVADNWTIVFWRSLFATLFLVSFMLWRAGPAGLMAMTRGMGLAGVAVGCCFAAGSTCLVMSLAHTSVANVMAIQAAVPLMAAALAWLLFRERVGAVTWAAIAAVVVGIGIVVSDSLSGKVSPLGDGLALIIAATFAVAMVITRRNAHVPMMPAMALGAVIAGSIAAVLAGGFAVKPADLALLFAFGALNLGLGLACFAWGARFVPAAVTGLVSTTEPVLSPLWVYLVHGEAPSGRALIGGAIVIGALLTHIAATRGRA